jgi:hypothetical protein
MNHTKPKLDFDHLAESLKSGLETYCDDASERHIGIEEFMLEYLDLGITPTQAQIALLKAFYGEELSVEQQSILECWKAEGRTNWEEGQHYQNLILEAGRRSGKCIVGSSWILTDRGWETLEELGEEARAGEAKENGKSWELHREVPLPEGTWSTSHYYYLGETNTIKIRTKNGYELEGTPEHRVWCKGEKAGGEWKTLGTLQPGDKVALWLGGRWTGQDQNLKEAYLLGVACGGNFSHLGNELRVDCRLRDSTFYRNKFRELGYASTYQEGRNRQRRHILLNKEVRAHFATLGLVSGQPTDVVVPKTIRLGSQTVQREFLRGLFENSEGDGYTLLSKSLNLLKQVQVMLLPFGIVSCVGEKKCRRQQPHYQLTLADEASLREALHVLPLHNPSKAHNEPLPNRNKPRVFVWEEVQELQPGWAPCMDLHVPGPEAYIAQGFINHNTSLCASVIGAYEFFKLARMKCPQEHYGIAKVSTISILCLATQATQGQRTIFGGIKAVIQECKYFKRLIEAQELFLLDEEIRYPGKRLAIYAGTSKSSSQVGATLKALIMDEIARFENEKGINNALELWSNLGASTVTFGKDAIKVAISSAWCQGDAIQILREKAEYSPNCLSFSLRSWDLNPVKAARDNPIIVAAYAEDPIKAALEFENIRPAVGDSFIPLNEIEDIPKRSAAVKLEPTTVVVGGVTYRTVAVVEGKAEWCNTVLHIDPSMGKDGYGLAFGHSEFDEDGLQTVVIDGLGMWQKDHQHSIYLADVEKVILQIHKLRHIVKVSADHYGSGAETLQRLKMHGLRCETVYFSNRTQVEMYELLRQLIHQRRLVLPGDSYWTGLLIRELSRIQLIRGMKIDHPPGVNESKDLADAVAAVAWHLAQRTHIDALTPTLSHTKEKITPDAPQTPLIHPWIPPSVEENKLIRRQRYLSSRTPRRL